MNFYLDRFEEDMAVIECTENGKTFYIRASRAVISSDSREGDALIQNGEFYETDTANTERRRKYILCKLKSLKGR